ncbi:MAG: precorrin-6y C5,15-methyltransferase (decarboxylating) subunit CbiE [Methanobacterium sp.]|nr:precorrin-6y C5,15-methyltransferase (decarboxylating) subunit CbiE [Methanobacterium sp.]
MSKLYIVGIGPGSKEYLTQIAVSTVSSVDVVIGSKRALDLFDIEVQKFELNAKNMKDMMKRSITMVQDGKKVAILSTGDPGFSGILKPILGLNPDIDIEVIPGISSVQLCAAKLKIPWDESDIVTMHGKGINKGIMDLIDNGKPTIILPNFKPSELADFLIENGVNEGRKVAICEKLSYDDEKIVEMSLKDILSEDFSYMCVMVVY